MQITGPWGKVTIFNIYNDGEREDTLGLLADYHHRHRDLLEHTTIGTAHIIWLGDFNRHHPLWDSLEDTRLFTNEATEAAEKLIEVIADVGLELALPSGILTHEHSITKRWSRLDQVFLTDHSSETLITCTVLSEQRGINTDHLPILMELRLGVDITKVEAIPNFRNVNWEDFRSELQKQLDSTPNPSRISSQAQLDESPAGSHPSGSPSRGNHAKVKKMVDQRTLSAPIPRQQTRKSRILPQKRPGPPGTQGSQRGQKQVSERDQSH
jgi:hypothetical protein